MEEIFKGLRQAIIDLDEPRATELAAEVVAEDMDLLRALEACGEGLNEIGVQFEDGDVFLPELMRSGQIMTAVTAILEPAMKEEGTRSEALGRIVIGTVQGDVHDIGKNILGTMLLLEGFEVYDIGKDVPAERFVEEAEKIGADIVGASALLTTTMNHQKAVVDAFVDRGLRDKVLIMVGGSPVTPEWAQEIGADAYGENAIEGAKVARKLIERSRV